MCSQVTSFVVSIRLHGVYVFQGIGIDERTLVRNPSLGNCLQSA